MPPPLEPHAFGLQPDDAYGFLCPIRAEQDLVVFSNERDNGAVLSRLKLDGACVDAESQQLVTRVFAMIPDNSLEALPSNTGLTWPKCSPVGSFLLLCR